MLLAHTINVHRKHCLQRLISSLSLFQPKLIPPFQIKYFSSSDKLQSKTIFALSSGHGKCGVSIIRLSGPKSGFALKQLCGAVTKPRLASLCKISHPETKELLDRALVLWFPAPHSFTGEDVAELHVHGGPAVVAAVLEALGQLDGLGPASPGDFSRRSFLNGKLDLTEVEGLGDLIHAETEAQRKQAVRQMEGDLARLYTGWRKRIIKSLANVEAFIDFSEEENIEDDVMDVVVTSIRQIQTEMENYLKDSRRGERLRDGLRAVILGEPNVGKSSLLNFLCQRPAAIVSPMAGTTRDVVETSLNISGYPVLVCDTAGLRDTGDEVEKEGITRALDRAEQADLRIVVLDAEIHTSQLQEQNWGEFLSYYLAQLGIGISKIDTDTKPTSHYDVNQDVNKSQSVKKIYENTNTSNEDSCETLLVINKSDLAPLSTLEAMKKQCSQNVGMSVCFVSCKSEEGMEGFLEILSAKIKQLCGDPALSTASLTRTRHTHHLTQSLHFLQDFHLYMTRDVVLAAERLRLATRELGEVTGAVTTEDVLDVVFRDFCIGK